MPSHYSHRSQGAAAGLARSRCTPRSGSRSWFCHGDHARCASEANGRSGSQHKENASATEQRAQTGACRRMWCARLKNRRRLKPAPYSRAARCKASGCPPGVFLSLLRHMAFMDTLAALGWSICATGACAASHVEAPARLVGQHQNPAKWKTVLALLRYTHLPYSVASDSKLLETSRGLGTGGPAASRHRG